MTFAPDRLTHDRLARGMRDMTEFGRGPAAPDHFPKDDKTRRALGLMAKALDLIDANDGPHDVGAYLDQAICRLRDHIDKRGSSEPGTS